MRRRAGKRRTEKTQPLLEWSICAVLVLVLSILGLGFFSARVAPVFQQVAADQIQREVQLMVSQVVSEEVLEQYSYAKLITLERDGEGKVAAMTTNMAKVNGLKNHVISQLSAQLDTLPDQQIDVPVGSLTNVAFFTNKGFKMPVQVRLSGTIYAELVHDFTDAGINQSRHQITLELRIPIKAVFSGTVWEETVTGQVLIGETVIVGGVPETYMNMTTQPQKTGP